MQDFGAQYAVEYESKCINQVRDNEVWQTLPDTI